MSRNDSVLYTGASSASFSTPKADALKEKREADKKVRQSKQRQLTPAATPILELIEKHKQAAMHVLSVSTSENMSDAEAGEMLRSQRRIYAFLVTFEQQIKNTLKESL